MWLRVQSTSLSQTAEHYAESRPFPVTPCCTDTVKTLRRDSFLAMIHRLLSLPPIALKAAARAFPVVGQGGQRVEVGSDAGSRGAAAAACENVATDAEGAGTCRVTGPKDPLVLQEEGHAAHQVEEVGTGSNAAVEEEAGGGATKMP
jgi:hypothetical protein